MKEFSKEVYLQWYADIEDIYGLVDRSVELEAKIPDWIFEAGEIDMFSKEDLLNFMKYRVDDSLKKNAGKPLRQPCPNCFIIYCKDENEVENYYWTFFSLWKSKFFHRFLCGSVIDMLRITDLKKILIEKVQPNFENFEKNQILIERLKTVEKLNSEYSRRVQVLEKLRHQLIYHFYFV